MKIIQKLMQFELKSYKTKKYQFFLNNKREATFVTLGVTKIP